MLDRKTVAFYGSCTAGSSLVLCSKRIGKPFTLRRTRARFTLGTNNFMRLRFYFSRDEDTPSSGAPTGVSILAEYGQVDYIVGNNDTKDLENSFEVAQGGGYLKVYADNDDSFEHDVDVQMTIEFENQEVN